LFLVSLLSPLFVYMVYCTDINKDGQIIHTRIDYAIANLVFFKKHLYLSRIKK